jgi:hypothetical protein
MRRHEPDREHLSIDDEQLGRPDDELTVIDTSDVLAVRERAIACHLSQASPFDSLSPALRRRFLTLDHIVEVAPGELVEHVVRAPIDSDCHRQTNRGTTRHTTHLTTHLTTEDQP